MRAHHRSERRRTNSTDAPKRRYGTGIVIPIALGLLVVVASLVAWHMHQTWPDWTGANTAASSANHTANPVDGPLRRDSAPAPIDNSPGGKAKRAVSAMSLEQKVGQLVMVPVRAGTSPAEVRSLITEGHAGSVLLTGNWRNGVSGVKAATDILQGYAPANNHLLMATDQEGGLVQHLKGEGFDTMPSGVGQGRLGTDQLRADAARWGTQLAAAGVNVNLAPVLDTVQITRNANDPVGALDRDFSLGPAANADHGMAFVEGMRDSGIQSAIKHYPGLGAVERNTDFSSTGIVDMTTKSSGQEIGAFTKALAAKPAMVMMSLATYQAIDPTAPAAFSQPIVNGLLRQSSGFDGVVISDSLSATALSGFTPQQLGVKLVQAGGDLACIGVVGYVQPILDGLNEAASTDSDFADQVTRSATRVMTLKYQMGLAK